MMRFNSTNRFFFQSLFRRSQNNLKHLWLRLILITWLWHESLKVDLLNPEDRLTRFLKIPIKQLNALTGKCIF